MNASKENAQRARDYVDELLPSSDTAVTFIKDFLDAAKRKLPTDAAYKRDRQRRKKPIKALDKKKPRRRMLSSEEIQS